MQVVPARGPRIRRLAFPVVRSSRKRSIRCLHPLQAPAVPAPGISYVSRAEHGRIRVRASTRETRSSVLLCQCHHRPTLCNPSLHKKPDEEFHSGWCRFFFRMMFEALYIYCGCIDFKLCQTSSQFFFCFITFLFISNLDFNVSN